MILKNTNYNRTIASCFIGYVVQATICTLAPLLYVRFQTEFSFSLDQISVMIAVTFLVQLLIDLASSAFVERIGYRVCIVSAHFLAAAGFVMMGLLPDLLHNAYLALMISVVTYSIGAGLIEVLVSPIMEACPTKRKNAMMNLLHSCFAWGQVLVVAGSTLFFLLCGIDAWRRLCFIWAVIPFLNAFGFLFAPINVFGEGKAPKQAIRTLLRSKTFYLLLLMMITAGATELSVSQWASALLESNLHVTKAVGDLLGPCLFAAFMGLGRIIGTRFEDKDIEKVMTVSAIACAVSCVLIGIAPNPAVCLIGCALSGLCVSITWPMTLSLAAHTMPAAGTALFGLLAFGGDIGCSVGPSFSGMMAARFSDNLQIGILFSVIFPLTMLAALLLIRKKQ